MFDAGILRVGIPYGMSVRRIRRNAGRDVFSDQRGHAAGIGLGDVTEWVVKGFNVLVKVVE